MCGLKREIERQRKYIFVNDIKKSVLKSIMRV